MRFGSVLAVSLEVLGRLFVVSCSLWSRRRGSPGCHGRPGRIGRRGGPGGRGRLRCGRRYPITVAGSMPAYAFIRFVDRAASQNNVFLWNRHGEIDPQSMA